MPVNVDVALDRTGTRRAYLVSGSAERLEKEVKLNGKINSSIILGDFVLVAPKAEVRGTSVSGIKHPKRRQVLECGGWSRKAEGDAPGVREKLAEAAKGEFPDGRPQQHQEDPLQLGMNKVKGACDESAGVLRQ